MLTEISNYPSGYSTIPISFIYIPLLKKYLFGDNNRIGVMNNDGSITKSGTIPSGLTISNIGYGKDSTGAPQIYVMLYAGTTYYLYKVVASSLIVSTTTIATYTGNRFLAYSPFFVDETNNVMYGISNNALASGKVAKFDITTGNVSASYFPSILCTSPNYDSFVLDTSNFDTFKIYQFSSGIYKIFEGALSTNVTNSINQSNTLAALAWNSDLGIYRQVDNFYPYKVRDYKGIQAVASIVATKNDISQQNSGFVLTVQAKDSANASVPNAPVRTRVYGLNPVQTITSITRVGSTATATSTSHGYVNGDTIYIPAVGQYLDQPSWGVNQVEYSGFFAISNVTANTFDFTVSGTPATPATGTIIVARTAAPFGNISVAPISEAGKIFSNIAINVSPTTDITMTTDANGQINLTYVNSTTNTGTDVFRFDSL